MISLAWGYETCQEHRATAMSHADRNLLIVLRDLPGVMRVEALMAAPGEIRRLGEAEFQRQCNAVSEAYFGVTEADCRIEPPTHLSVNGCNADYSYSNQQALKDAEHEWNNFESSFFILTANRFPKKERFARLRDYGLDVLALNGKPLICWPYFGRQAVAAIEDLFEESKFDPDAACGKPAASIEGWASAMAQSAAAFRSSR